jgi:hypothetical protein
MVFPDQPKTDFLTNTFLLENNSGPQLKRVFWNWYDPMNKANEGKVVWEAPTNPRWHFGNTRALYKMYFTSTMRDPKEFAEQSACVRFARDFLPEVNKALAEVYSDTPGGEASAKPAGAMTTAEPKSEATKPAETATTEVVPSEKKATESTSAPEKELLGNDSAKPAAKAKP